MRPYALLLAYFAVGCGRTGSGFPQPAPSAERPIEHAGPIEYAGWPALTEPMQTPNAIALYCSRTHEVDQRGPHNMPAVRYFANPEGFDAVARGDSLVAVGTTVVKEKLWKPGEPASAVAAMVKREAGYDPEFGDWEYVYSQRNDDGTWKTERGKLDNCRACHHGTKETDFLFRTYRKK
jgi:hypothetical protein